MHGVEVRSGVERRSRRTEECNDGVILIATRGVERLVLAK